MKRVKRKKPAWIKLVFKVKFVVCPWVQQLIVRSRTQLYRPLYLPPNLQCGDSPPIFCLPLPFDVSFYVGANMVCLFINVYLCRLINTYKDTRKQFTNTLARMRAIVGDCSIAFNCRWIACFVCRHVIDQNRRALHYNCIATYSAKSGRFRLLLSTLSIFWWQR